jgi:hypothetical protein
MSALVSSTPCGHRIPPRVRDDHDTPLLVGRDGGEYSGDLYFGKAEYFFEWDWTKPANQISGTLLICPSGQDCGIGTIRKTHRGGPQHDGCRQGFNLSCELLSDSGSN